MISTHVLDTARGRPATGIRVELYRGDELLAAGETDEDGRIARARATSSPARTGSSSTRRRRSSAASSCELELDDGHYHVPLLVSPYACATYRGS